MSGPKLTINMPKVAAPAPAPTAVPAGVDGTTPEAKAEGSAEIKPAAPTVEEPKVEYAQPKRGCRFRFAKGEYVLGELDSLAEVRKWQVKNEVSPERLEVLMQDGTWVNLDKVKD